MKKILFVTNDLGSGGAEKSLVSLLSQVDYDTYEIDLMQLSEGDFFLTSLSTNVNILGINSSTNNLLFKSAKEGAKILFSEKKYITGVYLYLSQIVYRLITSILGYNGKIVKWNLLRPFIPRNTKKYDAAVAYNFDYPIHYIIDKVVADKKIGWIHGNYKLTKSLPMFDKWYFAKLRYIVTVSETCQKILNSVFPNMNSKIFVIENIVSPKLIYQMAAHIPVYSAISQKQVSIVTVARLSPEKGVDLAIKAMKLLKDDGFEIKWIIIGEGQERKHLEDLVVSLDLQKNILLVGETTNPYTEIKNSDIYVQPSYTEGKSIALEEAKILGKPLVVTNYSTVNDQIKNYENGLIVDITPVGIYNGVKTLIESPNLRSKLTDELLNTINGNEIEIQKFYDIINK